jgi:hypothetical protein
MNISRRLVHALTAVLLLVATVEAGTAIKKVPFTIDKAGHYEVTKDLKLTAASGAAIDITVSGVTLDLGGHLLVCTATADDTNSAIGIQCVGVSDITVRNGTVRGFLKGVELKGGVDSGRVLVEDLEVTNCGRTAIDVTAYLAEVRRCSIRDTGFVTNAIAGDIWGIVVTARTSIITGNQVVNIKGTGQTLRAIQTQGYTSSTIAGNYVTNPVGTPGFFGIAIFNGTANFATDNVTAHFTYGILFANGAPGKYRDNLTAGCTTPFSGGTAVGTNS